MDKLIGSFPQQLREAVRIGQAASIRKAGKEIRNIVVTGLGGSGIGGNLVSELVESELKVPFLVNKDYFLPAFVNEHTLVIASSYSGNTEETLNALSQAIEKKAHIICVTSGGRMLEIAKENGYDHVIVPGGNPPRASLGYSFVQQLYILNKLGLISDSFEHDLQESIKLLERESDHIQGVSKEIAERLRGKIPVVYVTTPMASVAVRFKQQINENSKMLCWNHTIPEMNHNELVGWRNKIGAWVPIFLRNKDDYSRNQQRIEINKEIVSQYSDYVLEIWSKGNSHIERAIYLINLTDWVSYDLAVLNQVDAVEVKVIDFLKNSLAKV